MTDIAGGMISLAWLFIACGVWSVMMGAMTVHCLKKELTEKEYYILGNEQWQRDQDELENER